MINKPNSSISAVATRPFRFLGDSTVTGVIAKNFFIGIVTLGIYRFWARTNLRIYFWHNTTILGEPLEYTGRGIELFIGFIIAMIILTPILALVSLAEVFFEPGSISYFAALGAGYGLAVMLAPIAIYRAYRYRLMRTSWRGVSGGLDGSAVRFLVISLGWGAISALTLGLAIPWSRWAKLRYVGNAMRFGTAAFKCKGSVGPLFKRWLLVWLPLPAVGLSLIALFMAFYGLAEDMPFDPKPLKGDESDELQRIIGEIRRVFAAMAHSPGFRPAAGAIALVIIAALLVSLVAYAAYGQAEQRRFLNNLSLMTMSFRSSLDVRRLVVIFIKGWLFKLGLLLVVPLMLYFTFTWLLFSTLFFLGGIILVVLLTLSLLFQLVTIGYVQQATLQHVVDTLEVTNIDDLQRIVQAPRPEQRFGEGLADALGAGSGV
jgi:uncharacterized membrane protein YjgN (DUF898 family)